MSSTSFDHPSFAGGTSEEGGVSGEVAPVPVETPGVFLGTIACDGEEPENLAAGVIVTPGRENFFRRDVYVGIRDVEQNREFIGRIVTGPFHNAVNGNGSPALDSPTFEYVTRGRVELLGEFIEGDIMTATATRPRPGAIVYILPDSELRRLLKIEGNLYLGHLVGGLNVTVHGDSTNKNFLPRNIGIFGTVGSGKSNTTQVIIEEVLKAGWAVVTIDVEGEYVRMNEPTDDALLIELLRRNHRLDPEGVDDLRVYVPSTGKSDTAAPIPFKVPISGLQPDIVSDLLELSEAETRVYATITMQAARQTPSRTQLRNSPAAQQALPSDGQPKRLYSLQDLTDGLIEGPTVQGSNIRLLPNARGHEVATASILRSKLLHLASSNVLDTNATIDVPELPIDELLVGGRLSVLDVSETNDRSRNITIAYTLQALFEKVIETPVEKSMPSGNPRPPLLVVVEEVHTFVSRAAAPRMRAVIDNLQVISRRGRKRWMALGLISQQPNHVPDELFELTNTRFIHQMKSLFNLAPLKQSTGSIDEALWSRVPSMTQGQCLMAGSVFKNPMFVDIRPARSRRLLIV